MLEGRDFPFFFFYQEYIQHVQGELRGNAGHQTQSAIPLRCEEQMSKGIILPQGGGEVTGSLALGLEVHVRVYRGDSSNEGKKTNICREPTMAHTSTYTILDFPNNLVRCW